MVTSSSQIPGTSVQTFASICTNTTQDLWALSDPSAKQHAETGKTLKWKLHSPSTARLYACCAVARQKRNNLLTTINTGEKVYSGRKDHNTGNNIMKPDVVLDYDDNIRLVHKEYMQIGNIECITKTKSDIKKDLFHFVDMCILNACILMVIMTDKKPSSLKAFCGDLFYQVLQRYGDVKSSTGRSTSRPCLPDRLVNILPPKTQQGDTRSYRKKAQRLFKVCATSERHPRARKLATQMSNAI